MTDLVIKGIIFSASFFSSLTVLLRIENWYQRQTILKKFSTHATPSAFPKPKDTDNSLFMAKTIGKLVVPKKEKEVAAVTTKLIHAGFRSKDAFLIYYGLRASLGAVLTFPCLVSLFLFYTGPATSYTLLFIPFAAGYYLPQLVLEQRLAYRKQQIFRELPNTLDLLMVCLKAGLGFDAALYRVCMELKDIAPVLAEEFGIYFLEVKSGLSRATALENLTRRNPSRSLKNIVTVLVQSATGGTDMVQALNIHTDAMRTRRRQAAEEQGAKLSTKLTLPLVLFILPAMMLILLGPVIVNVISFLKESA